MSLSYRPKEQELLELTQYLEELLEDLFIQQSEKALQVARTRVAHLTGDDILNPHDFPELSMDPIFNYEDGIAAGILSAKIAMSSSLKSLSTQIQESKP